MAKSNKEQKVREYQRKYQKERYTEDSEFREKKKQAAKEFQRKQAGSSSPRVNALDNIASIDKIGSIRYVESGRSLSLGPTMFCLNTTELAELLGGYKAHSIYRWQMSGFLPKPVVKAVRSSDKNTRQTQEGVYSKREAIAIARVIGKEQQRVFRVSQKSEYLKQRLGVDLGAIRQEECIHE